MRHCLAWYQATQAEPETRWDQMVGRQRHLTVRWFPGPAGLAVPLREEWSRLPGLTAHCQRHLAVRKEFARGPNLEMAKQD